jgi:hypothetical protein
MRCHHLHIIGVLPKKWRQEIIVELDLVLLLLAGLKATTVYTCICILIFPVDKVYINNNNNNNNNNLLYYSAKTMVKHFLSTLHRIKQEDKL